VNTPGLVVVGTTRVYQFNPQVSSHYRSGSTGVLYWYDTGTETVSIKRGDVVGSSMDVEFRRSSLFVDDSRMDVLLR
jgi:hypothetical protein